MPQISDFYGILIWLNYNDHMPMFLEVIKAEYMDGYRLRLYFNNGEVRIANLLASLKGEIFEPLKDIEFFKQFTVKFNTVEWQNGADFAPEYLYEISKAA